VEHAWLYSDLLQALKGKPLIALDFQKAPLMAGTLFRNKKICLESSRSLALPNVQYVTSGSESLGSRSGFIILQFCRRQRLLRRTRTTLNKPPVKMKSLRQFSASVQMFIFEH